MKELFQFIAALLLMVFVIFIAVSLMLTIFMGAPFIPTSEAKMQRMFKLANIKKGEKFYDLGAGDGRFVIAAAKLGAKAVGIEINPFQVLWCKWRIARAGLGKSAHVVRGNILKQDLSSADVLTCYLFPGMNKLLQPKLQRELRPGARVVTHLFRFHGWKPLAEDKKEQLYLYRIGSHQPKKFRSFGNFLQRERRAQKSSRPQVRPARIAAK